MDSLNNNDIILRITPYLNSHELLNLALTCKRFGGTNNNTKQNSSDTNNESHYTWSLMEEAACQIIDNAQEEERNALPRYDGETWLALYNELELLRSPLAFDQLIGGDEKSFYYVDGDKSCLRSEGNMWKTAISNNIMRSGKHYVTFRKTGRGGLCVGVIRPMRGLKETKFRGKAFSPLHAKNWPALRSQGSSRWGIKTSIHCCLYKSFNGRCGWSDWSFIPDNNSTWSGQELLSVGECDVGMLLDLDEGTLSVYVDGRRLGIMKSVSMVVSLIWSSFFIQRNTYSISIVLQGLSGEYCWMALMDVLL